MGYTEFYGLSGGDNLAAGSTANTDGTAKAPAYTSVAGKWDGVSVFTPTDGSTPANTVNVGDFMSVYITIGATVAVYVARVTVVGAGVNGQITLSTTAKSGTAPIADAVGLMTGKVGGSWAAPTGATLFPVSFFKKTLVNVSGNMPRLNGVGTWSMTATLTQQAGPLRIDGMTAVPGDGGFLTIDEGAGARTIINLGADAELANTIVRNNSGNNSGIGGNGVYLKNVRVTNIGGNGIQIGNVSTELDGCEIDNCNTSNSASSAGIVCTTFGGVTLNRCMIHHNVGSNSAGISQSGSGGGLSLLTLVGCCVFANSVGIRVIVDSASVEIKNCDFYNNTIDGIRVTITSGVGPVYLENCNFCLNAGVGVNSTGAGVGNFHLTNCGFGTGADANGTDVVAASATVLVENIGSISYVNPTNPWLAASTGNFSIASDQAMNKGIGSFLETGESQSGTVAYPDIGAGQHFIPAQRATGKFRVLLGT